MYTISSIKNNYFKNLLKPKNQPLATGWTTIDGENELFIEPPVELRSGNPDNAMLWLISAAGAVGKTTFARQLARKTGAIYLDLSIAESIGGHYISGGLEDNGLKEQWDHGNLGLFVDAIDEAAIRVPFTALEAFINNAHKIATKSKRPLIILGRSNSIDDCDLILQVSHGYKAAIFDIGYFSMENSVEFTYRRIKEKVKEKSTVRAVDAHELILRERIQDLLISLRQVSQTEKQSFCGYAPVLDAVATYFASSTNYSKFDPELKILFREHVLEGICRSILEREQNKIIDQLDFDIKYKTNLYSPDEQLQRLCAHCLNKKQPDFPELPPKELQQYKDAVTGLLPLHPFLNGSNIPVNAVFESALQAYSVVKNGDREIFIKCAVSPLFAEFYFSVNYLTSNIKAEKSNCVDPQDVATIFNSYEARKERGDSLILSIEAEEEDSDARVAITKIPFFLSDDDSEKNKEKMLLSFTIRADSIISFQDRIANVSIDAPNLTVKVIGKPESRIFAPINIRVSRFIWECETLFIAFEGYNENKIVIFQANEVDTMLVQRISMVPNDIKLYISWNNRQYPWTAAEQLPPIPLNLPPQLKTSFHSFCKLIECFQSHSKGALARFEDKIEHERMSRLYGEEIRKGLEEEFVISHSSKSHMYYLNPDKLGQITGMNYNAVVTRQWSEKLKEWLLDIIK